MAGRGQYSLSDVDQPQTGQFSSADIDTDQPGPLARFFSPAVEGAKGLVKQILKPADDPKENRYATLAKNVRGVLGNLMDAQDREKQAMEDSWKAGDHKSAIAHGIAALTPILGPMSQDAADKINKGDLAGGMGTFAMMAAPEIAGPAADLAKVTGRGIARAATKVADVAASPGGLRAAGGALGATGGAALGHALGVPGAGEAGAIAGGFAGREAGNAAADLLRQAKAARVNPAVARVQEAFDPTTAQVQVSPGNAPLAGPVPVPRGTPADVEPTMIPRGTGSQIEPNYNGPGAMPQSGLQPAQADQSTAVVPIDRGRNPEVVNTDEAAALSRKAAAFDRLTQAWDPDTKVIYINGASAEDFAPKSAVQTLPDAMRDLSPETREAAPSAEDAKADRIKELTQPNGTPSLQDAMKDIPGPMRKAAADANYRASQNGEPAADAGATYKAAARATKVEALGQHLMDAGFSPEKLESFPPAKLKEELSQRIKTLGLNKTGAISDQTISDTIAWMRRQAQKP